MAGAVIERVTVTLTEEQITYCVKIARRRQESAERHARPGGNGGPVCGSAALDIHKMGVFGECAAYLWLKPIQWHRFQESGLSTLPDLADFIDVKTRKFSWHQLIVQKADPDEWAYLLVNSERHPDYEIVGWLWGHEAKARGTLRDPVGGREAFFVPERALRDPLLLKELWDGKR